MRVSGKVQNGNLVMYDEQTGSLWLQETGTALEGELADRELSTLPATQVDPGVRWDEWIKKHPATKVLHCDHCVPRARKSRG